MKPIPLNFQTMYADLLQSAGLASVPHGSITKRKIKGKDYLYLTAKDGAARRQTSLGPASDAKVQRAAREILQASRSARARRMAVTALKRAFFPAPSLQLGRILEALSNAALFENGAVLVGTGAYQTYSGLTGAYLPEAALATNDADILVTTLILKANPQDLEKILQRANPSFKAHMSRTDRLPKIFKSDDDFQVDVLTSFGRGRKSPIAIDGLKCAAEALTFMEYLGDETVEAVALYGAGVVVRVPDPARYAIHKLLIAPERKHNPVKRNKDLSQAKALMEILEAADRQKWADVMKDARSRGPRWRNNIDRSLQQIASRDL